VLGICHCDLLVGGGLAEGNMRRVTGVDGGVGSTGGGRWAEEVGGGCEVIRETSHGGLFFSYTQHGVERRCDFVNSVWQERRRRLLLKFRLK